MNFFQIFNFDFKTTIFFIFVIIVIILIYYFLHEEKNDTIIEDNDKTIIVSLTTSPKRIKLMKPVIDSILNQTYPPDLIRINIPKIFKRFNQTYEIPDFITNNNKIQVFQYDKDYGPIMKILPTIIDYKEHPNISIIYTDDDVLMLPKTIETFVKNEHKYKSNILCFSGFNFETINSWNRPNIQSDCYVDIAEGYMSVFLNNDVIKKLNSNITLMNFYNMIENNEYCFTSDDLILSNFFEMKNLKKVKLYDKNCNFDIWWESGCELSYGRDGDGIMHLSNDQHFSRYLYSIDFLNKHGINFLLSKTQLLSSFL